MPRTVEEILARADELAKKFEKFEPDTGTAMDGRALRDVREGFEDLARAQQRLTERVAVARASGHSWATIGAMLGTSGEAARQRYNQAPTGKTAPGRQPAKKTATSTKAAGAKGTGEKFVARPRRSA